MLLLDHRCPRKIARRLVPVVAALACALGSAAPTLAQSSSSSVPDNFFAMNWDILLAAKHSPSSQNVQFGHMAAAGVEAVRALFIWSDAQPDKGGGYSFAQTDALVRLAAEHNLSLLPTVMYAPTWAAISSAPGAPPRHPADYAAYLTALIGRYGPGGSFWSDNPDLPAMPIRAWQVWNEENLGYQFSLHRGEDYGPIYARLLKVSYKAIKQADPGAQVVLGGIANDTPAIIEHLYKSGIHGYFDIVDIHPYTTTARGVYELTAETRAKMRANGDGRKPIWVGELGLPASKGRDNSKNLVQTTDKGMAKFLTGAYTELIHAIHSLGVARVYWYDWASQYKDKKGQFFDYAGLVQWRVGQVSKPRPAFKDYVELARKYEGCQKTTTAQCVQPSNPYYPSGG